MLPIHIKRIDPTLPLPVYETEGSVGFDLLARTDVSIAPKSLALIPSNVIVEVPPEYMLMIAARSSTPRRKGLLVPHGIGVIDHDFCGPDDEILIQVYNFTEQDVTVARGEKIAQGILVKIGKCEFVEVNDISRKTRGGFGSTG
ncbi:dUTP diphosphatase [Candidatus Peregrinibacteria bacterium]|nr:dUTP diphosphatase [Candidatus Peregrinibacteria bacterium]